MVSPAQNEFGPLTRALARRLNFAVWLNAALGPCAWVVGGYATALVCAKLLSPDYARHCVWIFTLLPAALVAPYYLCKNKRRFFSAADLVETADHLYRNDGSVTAVWERPGLAEGGDFARTVRAALGGHMPRLKPGHYLRRIAPAALYAAVALVMPARPAAASAPRVELQQALTQPLMEKIEAMQEFVPEEQAAQLNEEVKAIAQNPQGISREQWEAIEEVGRRIDESAAKTADQASKARAMLQQAGAMLGQKNTTKGAEQDKADPKLKDLLDQLSKLNNTPNNAMSSAMRKQMDQLLSECMNAKPGECKSLCDKLGKMCDKLGMCAGNGLKPGNGNGSMPGRGGVTRGRGDAALIFGEEQKLAGGKYEEKKLDVKYMRLEDMANLGVTPVEPKPDPGRFSPGTIQKVDTTQAAPVSRARISPGQRDVIQKYFSQTAE